MAWHPRFGCALVPALCCIETKTPPMDWSMAPSAPSSPSLGVCGAAPAAAGLVAPTAVNVKFDDPTMGRSARLTANLQLPADGPTPILPDTARSKVHAPHPRPPFMSLPPGFGCALARMRLGRCTICVHGACRCIPSAFQVTICADSGVGLLCAQGVRNLH